MFAVSSRRVLPGFTLSLGTSLLFVCLILLLPLSALVMQLAQMSWAQYWEVTGFWLKSKGTSRCC